MSDEERKQAERLAEQYAAENRFYDFSHLSDEPLAKDIIAAVIQGYAAACEAKREVANYWYVRMNEAIEVVRDERARSENLLEALRQARLDVERHYIEAALREIDKAIAEYGKSR